MADLSFPLDKPLSSLEMKTRLLQFNEKLHAVRKWKDPQADKAIHLLVKDNIGVSGFPTSAGSYALKDLELPDAFCIQRLRRNRYLEAIQTCTLLLSLLFDEAERGDSFTTRATPEVLSETVWFNDFQPT